MTTRTCSTMAAGLLVLLMLANCGSANDPEEVARAWCAAVERRDDAAAEALMSEQLRAAVARARTADAAFRAANPGDKPPLGDGLRLTSFPDAVERCAVERVEGDVAVLKLEPKGAPESAWKDRLHLRHGEQGVEVDDVGFAPEGQERLRAWLATGGM